MRGGDDSYLLLMRNAGTPVRQYASILQPLAGGQLSFFITSLTAVIMDRASIRRKDLVKNFASSYTYSGLTLHFTSEYKRVVGRDPPNRQLSHWFTLIPSCGRR
jgi:hypothetical protein